MRSVESRGRLPDSYPIMSDIRSIAAALGVVSPVVCRGTGRSVELLLTEPRAIVIGADLLTDVGRPVALFHLAYACVRIAAYGSIYAAPREQVLPLLEAAIHPDADGPGVRDLRKRISSALPRKNKKELERIVGEGGGDLHKDLPIWAAEEGRRALFAATLFCRDLRAVAQVLAEPALAMPRIEDRRRALVGNSGLREALELITSPSGWDVFQRIYGRP